MKDHESKDQNQKINVEGESDSKISTQDAGQSNGTSTNDQLSSELSGDSSKNDSIDTSSNSSTKMEGQSDNLNQQDVDTHLESLQTENQKLNQEISELKDQYLRKQADFDNFRKRLIRDKEESIQFANKKILEDLVPVIDDFERAIKSSEDSKDFQLLHDGIQLIEKQLVNMLEKKWGLIRFDSLDQEFDPQKHEAVSAEPREGDEVQKVIEEYQKGYLLNERVLRTAKVKVSMPVVKGE
jgi:molecular chaperone GrpE